MAYRVSLVAPAETDAYTAFERIREAAPLHAEKWLTGLFEAIFSLEEIPARCPVISEAKELGYTVRFPINECFDSRRTGSCSTIGLAHLPVSG